MSIATILLEIGGSVASHAATKIPGATGSALPAQIKVFGNGGTVLLQEAEAAAHNEDPAVVLAAIGAGMIFATAFAVAGGLTVGALMGAGYTLAQATIAAGTVEFIAANAASWAAQPIFQALKDSFDEYGWAFDNPGEIMGELPPWMQNLLGPLYNTPGVNPATVRGTGGGDPLVLDLDGDGKINLTSITNGVHYDFHQDGFAERTGWVAATDGMLVIDKDGDGLIEGAPEMIASPHSLASLTEKNWTGFQNDLNGFAQLAKLDSNKDGVFDSRDAAFTQVRVWQDLNQDGVSQAGELKTLASLNIKSIDISGAQLDQFYGINGGGFRNVVAGNTITHKSTFTMNDGTQRQIVDAWLDHDLANSKYTGSYTLNPKTLFLPTLAGYGALPDLHVAMSKDASLLTMVETFTSKRSFTQEFTDFALVKTEVRAIMMKWAGINETAPVSNNTLGLNGVYALMPEYRFLKIFTGMNGQYDGPWFDERPFVPMTDEGIRVITKTFDALLSSITAKLLYQSGASALFQTGTSYDPFSDTYKGAMSISSTSLAQLKTAAASVVDKQGFWANFVKIVDATTGISNLTAAEITSIDTAISQSTSNALTWTKLLASFQENSVMSYTYSPTMTGTLGDDRLQMYDPSSLGLKIYGKDGNDTIFGGNGKDWLEGGLGNDSLTGWWGDDTYYYESGHDVINESSPYYATEVNTIEFAPGILPSDIVLKIMRSDELFTRQNVLIVNGRGTVTIQEDGYGQTGLTDIIDRLKFSNGTIINIADIKAQYLGSNEDDLLLTVGQDKWNATAELYGFDGNDTIYGWGQTNNGKSEIIVGGAGNDLLYGMGGDDIYIYESGNDKVEEYANGGIDTLKFGPGILASDISIERVIKSSLYDSDIVINVKNKGSILLPNQNDYSYLEKVELPGGTIINMTGISLGHTINGGTGNDILNGLDSHPNYLQDIIVGNDGNDTIDGKKGNDILSGGNGDDTYILGDGFDTIVGDTAGNDKIVFDNTYDPTKFTFTVGGQNNSWLDIGYNGVQKVRIINQFWGHGIESLIVTGKSTINLTTKIYDVIGDDTNNSLMYIYLGGSPDTRIFGMGGNDFIDGGVGNDFIEGGRGNDWLRGNTGNDIYYFSGDGYEGLDFIQDSAGVDTIQIGGGVTAANITVVRPDIWSTDLIVRLNGKDFIRIGEHLTYKPVESIKFDNNTTLNIGQFKNIMGDANNNILKGLDLAAMQDDVLRGWSGNDTITGGVGNDYLMGDDGDDILDGGVGDDTLEGSYDNDKYIYNSGGGSDSIYDVGGSADYIQLGAGYTKSNITLKAINNNTDLAIMSGATTLLTVKYQFGYYSGIETLKFSDGSSINLLTVSYTTTGTSGNDSIYGMSNNAAGDKMYLLDGNDWTNAGDGNDYISGGNGNDTVYGGNGDDQVYGDAGDDTVSGDEGNDLIVGGSGNDNLWGGNGNDVYEFGPAFGKDSILYDYSGIDTIAIKAAGITVDTISITSPSSYETRIISTPGIDEISLWDQQGTNASRKIEFISFADGFKADLINYKSWVWGSTSAQTTNGTTGADTILGRGGNDTINGNAGNDALHGGSGNDTVRGGDGDDLVHGGIGTDSLYGDNGNDILYGDDGLDNLWGGAGIDTFVFMGATAFKNIDVINDFSKSQNDKIDVHDLLQGYDPVTKAITDFVQITTSGSDSILKVDIDGGANNFVQIATIKGVTGLTDEAALMASGHLIV